MRNNYADTDTDAINAVDEDVASGTDAEVNIAADSEQFWAIDWISWSYDEAPASGSLRIEIGGVIVWKISITAAGPGHIEFLRPIYTNSRTGGQPTKGEAVDVILADGSTTCSVNVRYR